MINKKSLPKSFKKKAGLSNGQPKDYMKDMPLSFDFSEDVKMQKIFSHEKNAKVIGNQTVKSDTL